MPPPKRTPEQLKQALEAVEAHGGNVAQAARSLGIPVGTFQHIYQDAKAKEHELQTRTESRIVKGDSCEITKNTKEEVRTLEDLIRVCQIDTDEWEIERWIANKWEVGAKIAKDGEETMVVTPLFQVKAWLKRRKNIVLARLEIADLKAEAHKAMPKPKRIVLVRKVTAPTNILFEPQIPDLHAGKLAWGDETGWENYDLGKAEEVFEAALEALIERSKSFGCDRVLMPLGNDLLHSDTKQGTTTSGTQLDNDSRYQKVFATVRRMCVRAIDRCREEIGPVKVVMVPGNHDALSNWHLGDSLECWYRREKDVQIDNGPALRKYHQHGLVLLMHTHGNRGKLDKYPEIMAAERPDLWGATKFREAHTGDKHHQRVLELRGCKVRISPALCPPDAWHSEMTFIGVQRSAESFCWHPEEGLIGTAFYTVPSDRSDAA